MSEESYSTIFSRQGLEISGRLVGKAAFTRFFEVLLDPRFRDAGRAGHFWLIVQKIDKEESPSFYRGTVSGDSYGSLTKLKDPKKPESRIETGHYGELYEMVASHAKRSESNGTTFIPSFPAWHPLKTHFRSSNIVPVEFDQIGLDEQWQLFEYLKTYGLTPAAVVHSGSKSLHFYFMLDREIDEGQLTFIKNEFVPLGADPKPCKNVVNSYRLPGFYRASKDREQTLEYCAEDAATVALSPDEFTRRLQAALEGKGHTTKSFEEHQAEAQQKQERAASYEAADLGIYDGNDLQRLVNEVLAVLPPRNPGTGTYEPYRQIAKAIANLIGEENAIALMENHSPGETSWRQIITTTTGQFRFKAIIEAMRYLVDPEWSLPDWFGEKYNQKTENQKDDYIQKCWQSWEDSKKLTPDIVTNQEFFEYPVLQKSNTIELGKVRLGGGKTTNLRNNLIEHCQKTGVVSLGYRNLLLIQFGEHKDFKENKLAFYHINNDSKDIYFADPNLWLSSCVDSILKIPLDFFEDKIIILDEVNSIIKHLLFSSTIKKRPKVIQHFFEAIRRCDRVLAMDGHLADWVVDFFKGINTGKNIVTVENQFKAQKAPLTILEGTVTDDDILKANDRSPLIKQMLAEKENFAVCSDSQIFLESIEKLLINQGKKTLRIDSKTAKDIVEIIKDIDNYLKANPDTILLYSPSAESGLDISIKGYFKKQFCLSFGVLDVDSTIQLYNRIRDVKCHKIVWAAQFAKSDDPSDARSYDAEVLAWYQNQALSRDLHAVMSGEAGGLEAIANILKMVQESHGTDSRTANRLQGIRNFERANFRECLKRMLALTGCDFDTVCFAANDPEDFAARQELKEATDEVKDQNAQDIFNAGDDFVGKSIPSTGDADWPTRCKIEKARLIERLPWINQSEFWNPGLIRRLRYDEPLLLTNLERYHLAQNLDLAKTLSIINYEKLNQDAIAGEHFCLWKHRTDYSMVKALADLGLFELAESGKSYTADSPEIKAIIKKCRTKPIQHSLKRSPGKDPMKFIGRLLRLIGLEWRRKSERLPDGRIENRYTVINPVKNDPLLTYLVECQAGRLESKVNQYTVQKQSQNLSQSPHQKQWCGEGSQSLTTQGLEAVTLSANFYNKNTSEVLQDPSSTPFKPGDRVRCQGEDWLLEIVGIHNANATLRFLGIGDCESLIELETSYLIPEAAHA